MTTGTLRGPFPHGRAIRQVPDPPLLPRYHELLIPPGPSAYLPTGLPFTLTRPLSDNHEAESERELPPAAGRGKISVLAFYPANLLLAWVVILTMNLIITAPKSHPVRGTGEIMIHVQVIHPPAQYTLSDQIVGKAFLPMISLPLREKHKNRQGEKTVRQPLNYSLSTAFN